jgi:CheY-like chemotaxis protein
MKAPAVKKKDQHPEAEATSHASGPLGSCVAAQPIALCADARSCDAPRQVARRGTRPMTEAPILIVEDEDDTAHSVRELLAEAGFVVDHALNGLEGIDYLRAHPPPAMILLDWSMPLMNGRQMAEAMKAEPAWQTIPIVLFTADPDARARALEIRATGYLKKPCAPRDLLTMVDQTVRHP